jgi:hypothetical protein
MAEKDLTDFATAQCGSEEGYLVPDAGSICRSIVCCATVFGASAGGPGELAGELAAHNSGCAATVDEALAAREAVARGR